MRLLICLAPSPRQSTSSRSSTVYSISLLDSLLHLAPRQSTPSRSSTVYSISLVDLLLHLVRRPSTPSRSSTVYSISLVDRLLDLARRPSTPSRSSTVYSISLVDRLLHLARRPSTPSRSSTVYSISLVDRLLHLARRPSTPSPRPFREVPLLHTSPIAISPKHALSNPRQKESHARHRHPRLPNAIGHPIDVGSRSLFSSAQLSIKVTLVWHVLPMDNFLNNLRNWEMSLKDNENQLKAQTLATEKEGVEIAGNDRAVIKGSSKNKSNDRQYCYLRSYDEIAKLSSNCRMEESSIDACSEKELGNEFFKQKKFNEAINCYSRSIALSPTAVSFANRAMAYLKIKRYQEAEDDCTEALNLDDHYIKAYSRRSKARKELGKLKDSVEDAEFALRLEPQNQEIKKQYAEAKSLYEKEILEKTSGSFRSTMEQMQKEAKLEVQKNKDSQDIPTITTGSQRMGASKACKCLVKRNERSVNEDLNEPLQQLAAQASALAMARAADNIAEPKSAYQFELSWRRLSGDPALQTHLLKATLPTSLPKIFKNALSTVLLMEIIKCIASIFIEEIELAVKYLENLSKVPRFDMIIMSLSSMDKDDLLKLWDDIFCSRRALVYADILAELRSRYLPNQ